MLKHLGNRLTLLQSAHCSPISLTKASSSLPPVNTCSSIEGLKQSSQRTPVLLYAARRRVRYDAEDEDEDEEYGHNEQIGMLELYTQSARGEALIVHAMADGEEVEVLIFKGFSSCLSYGTSPDPSKSILPARAIISSIDRIRGPFDPSNIEYLQKGLSWEAFQSNFLTN